MTEEINVQIYVESVNNEEKNIPVRYFGETIDLTSIQGSCSNFG